MSLIEYYYIYKQITISNNFKLHLIKSQLLAEFFYHQLCFYHKIENF